MFLLQTDVCVCVCVCDGFVKTGKKTQTANKSRPNVIMTVYLFLITCWGTNNCSGSFLMRSGVNR